MVFKRPSRSIEGEKGEFTSHRKLKGFAYRMARRLLRKGDRKIRSGHGDSGMMEMQMLFAGDSDTEDEDTRTERRKTRMEKNREWRKKREMARWESCGLEPPPSPTTERENNRLAARDLEKQLCKLLQCTNCGDQLLPHAWQCGQGHMTCGHCFDREHLGQDVQDGNGTQTEEDQHKRSVVAALQRSLSSTASIRSKNASMASLDTITSIVTVAGIREELATLVANDESEEFEHKSFSKYRIDEIDFFLDTLEIRGDAISCYADYNNQGRTIFYDPEIEALQLEQGVTENKKVEPGSDLYKDEKSSRVMAYMDRLRNKGSIASLRETLIDIVQTPAEDTGPSWAKYRLEELDFFLDTLDIRRDAITYYGDYRNNFKSIFHTFKDSKDSVLDVSSQDTSTDEEIEEDLDSGGITRCVVCNEFILRRNYQVERVAEVFFDV